MRQSTSLTGCVRWLVGWSVSWLVGLWGNATVRRSTCCILLAYLALLQLHWCYVDKYYLHSPQWRRVFLGETKPFNLQIQKNLMVCWSKTNWSLHGAMIRHNMLTSFTQNLPILLIPFFPFPRSIWLCRSDRDPTLANERGSARCRCWVEHCRCKDKWGV